MKYILSAVLLTASLTPALADGVVDVMATVEMRVGVTHCRLYAPEYIRDPIVKRALEFTGMDQQTYSLSMIKAADQKAAELIDTNQLMSFCQNLRAIYGVR